MKIEIEKTLSVNNWPRWSEKIVNSANLSMKNNILSVSMEEFDFKSCHYILKKKTRDEHENLTWKGVFEKGHSD